MNRSPSAPARATGVRNNCRPAGSFAGLSPLSFTGTRRCPFGSFFIFVYLLKVQQESDCSALLPFPQTNAVSARENSQAGQKVGFASTDREPKIQSAGTNNG